MRVKWTQVNRDSGGGILWHFLLLLVCRPAWVGHTRLPVWTTKQRQRLRCIVRHRLLPFSKLIATATGKIEPNRFTNYIWYGRRPVDGLHLCSALSLRKWSLLNRDLDLEQFSFFWSTFRNSLSLTDWPKCLNDWLVVKSGTSLLRFSSIWHVTTTHWQPSSM